MIEKINGISALLAEGEPERLEDFKKWLTKWFKDEIPGKKHTITKVIEGRTVGVARLWYTPHLNIGYLVEGLEVSKDYRRQGIAKEILLEAMAYLKGIGETHLYSSTHENNLASINTHLSVGFEYDTREPLNSFGDLRPWQKVFIKKL